MKSWLMIAALALGTTADAQERRMFGMPTYDFVFPTGFRIVVQPDDTAPVVGATMVFEVGSADDPADRTGLAHFVEHLWFRSHGTDELPIFERLDALGCEFNAMTTFDTTDYRTACPEGMFTQLMKLEARRLTDVLLQVTEEEVVVERDVVRNELRSGAHGLGRNPMELILSTTYGKHGYGHLPGGSEEHVAQVTLSDARTFVDTHYKAANATLVITGAVDPARALRLALKTFPPEVFHPDLTRELIKRTVPPGWEQVDPKGWMWPMDPANPTERLAMATPVKRIEGYARPDKPSFTSLPSFEAKVEDPVLVASWTLPPFDSLDTHFNTGMLAGRATGWAREKVSKKHGRGVGCSAIDLRESTLLMCAAELTAKGSRDVLLEQLSSIATGRAPTADRKADSKLGTMFRRLSHLGMLEPIATASSGRNSLIAHHVHRGRSADYLREVDVGFQELMPGAAHNFLVEYVEQEDALWMELVPTPEAEIEAGDALGQASYALVETVLSEQALSKLDANGTHFDPTRVKTTRLPTGLTIVAIDHGNHPMVEAMLYVPVGRTSAPAGVDRLAERVATWERKSGLAFQRTTTNRSSMTYSVRGLRGASSNYKDLVQDLRTGMDTLTVGEGVVVDELRSSVRNRKKWADEPWYQAQRAGFDGLGPWRSSPINLSDAEFEFLRTVRAGDVRSYIRTKWRPSKAILVVVGAANAEDMLAAAKNSFLSWKGQPATPPKWTSATAAPDRSAILIGDKKAHTANVTVSCITDLDKAGPDAVAMAGGLLRQVQMRAVRTQTGLAYTPWASIRYGGTTARISLSAEVSPGRVGEVIEVERTVLDSLAGDVIQDEDVAAARARVALGSPLQHQTRSGVRESLVPRLLSGWSLNDWFTTPKTLEAVDKDILREIFANCTDRMRVEVTGPSDAYADDVAKALPGVDVQRFELDDDDDD